MRYTVIMSGKTAFRIAGCKPIGWVFAFVLGITQMYPAFGACICLREAQETAEVSISSEDTSSCRLAARQPVTREEMDCGSGHCSQDAGRTCAPPRISRDNCCGAGGAWTSPVPASRRKMNVPQGSRVVSSRHRVTARSRHRLNPEPAAVIMTE